MNDFLLANFLKKKKVDWTKVEQQENINIYRDGTGKIICYQVCDNKSCTYIIKDKNGKQIKLTK